jgi:elongation factor P
MATTSDISRGAFIRYNGELVMITDYTHITPGKGNAIYTVKARNIKTGKQTEIRFRSGEKVDFVRVETLELQYLYQEGDALICMNQESYEQLPIPMNLFGDSMKFLKEGMLVQVKFDDNEEAIYAEPPMHVELEVTYTEPGIKGDTATRTLKPATVETGATVNVPLFVDTGEKIKIETATGAYVERVK